MMFRDLVIGMSNATAAAHALAAAIPTAHAQGTFMRGKLVFGTPVSWHSETSPGYISNQQVVEFGASCTGTAILMASVFRSVGLPARVTGCSESIVRDDDHHWMYIVPLALLE